MRGGLIGGPRTQLFFLLGLCAWLFCFRLGAIPFMGKDEPKNAEATREMMERHDWVTPTLGGELWFDKPILFYWCSLALFHLLGPGELAARLPCALFGAGTVLLTWSLGRKLWGDASALRSGVILATSIEYFWFSRTAVTDLPLTFCVTACLIAFFRAFEGAGDPRIWYPVAFAAAGAAALAKGPVGVVLPGLVAGATLFFTRRIRELTRIPWVTSLAAFLAVSAPWYLLVSLKHGRRFWEDFIINRNLERYTSTIHHHPGPVYYYLPILVIGLFPWGALFPQSAWLVLREGPRALRTTHRPLGFLLLWVLMPLLFFSFAGSKLPSYLLPCFPALAVLTAYGWEHIIERPVSSPMRKAGVALLVALFPILAIGLYGWCRSEAPDQLRAQLPLAGALALTASVLLGLALKGRQDLLFPACTAGMVISLTALPAFSLRNVREEASLTRIAATGVRLSREGKTVVAYRNFHNYLYFYTENRVPYVKKRGDLDELLAKEREVYCFLEGRGLQELSDGTLKVEPLDRQSKVVLARVTRSDREVAP